MKIKKVKSQQTSTLSKAVTNVKQIIKKKNKESVTKKIIEKPKRNIIEKTKKNIIEKTKKNIEKPKKNIIEKPKKSIEKPKTRGIEDKPYRTTRGVVYVGHIPYGFFEDEMKEYFEQFGTVTRVRVVRSKKTGKSRGYAYIEFKLPEVAKIAAETMNNYLMCGRLLKTTYIPPEKQHWGFFCRKAWTEKTYPKLLNRIKEINKNESPISDVNYTKSVRRSLRQISALEQKLKSTGINIKFKLASVP